MSADLREEADRILARGAPGANADRALTGIGEVLYRQAQGPAALVELRDWLAVRVKKGPALRPWLALVRLACAALGGDEAWAGDLEEVKAAARLGGRAALVLRTEAARCLYALRGAAAAWEWLCCDKGLPDPGLAEIAADAVVLRLRLAAAAGKWDGHDELAGQITPEWQAATGSSAARVALTLAAHEAGHDRWDTALRRLACLEEHPDDGLRMAALAIGLHVRILCGGRLRGSPLGPEIQWMSDRLAALLAAGPPAATLLPPDEWEEARRRAGKLLQDGEPDPQAELAELEEALYSPTGVPEIDLRRRLHWARLALELEGRRMASTCEHVLQGVVAEAEMYELAEIETRAWDLLAILRASGPPELWQEGLEAAGQAANLAAHLLALNRGSRLERSLRANLLPVFDRAVELLAHGARRAASRATDPASRERFGRALLDYAEQSICLALSEARSRLRSASGGPVQAIAGQEQPVRSEDLQFPLHAGEAVLQYFLAAQFLLVFGYGRDFFVWSLDALQDADLEHPLPVRVPFEKDLARWRWWVEWQGPHRARNLSLHADLPQLEEEDHPDRTEILQRLASHLLPTEITNALERQGVQRLVIVPHDVLYRAPFGLLPLREAWLGTRFGLSLQPTGTLAGTRATTPWRPRDRRLRVGFIIGPDLKHADREGKALAAALGRRANVVLMDTGEHPTEALEVAQGCDVLYLACHGNMPEEDNPEEAFLELGPPGEKLPLARVASLELGLCGLMVLQSCWTGWMAHLREHPVQGFPQALLDAGARAVVAPMLPVDDSLCPIFTAVYGRVLLFLPACEALARTLEVLRRYSWSLVVNDFDAVMALRESGGFEAFEYRFTGDPEVDLTAGRVDRLLAKLRFHLWLVGQRAWNHPLSLDIRRLSAECRRTP